MTRDDIRIRIMQEALDCADRGETEAYNSIKVMCSEVLQMVERLVEAEREACAKLCEEGPLPKDPTPLTHIPTLVRCAAAIRAREEK